MPGTFISTDLDVLRQHLELPACSEIVDLHPAVRAAHALPQWWLQDHVVRHCSTIGSRQEHGWRLVGTGAVGFD